MSSTSDLVNLRVLHPEESSSSVCRTLIKVFLISNSPRNSDSLLKDYLDVCRNVKTSSTNRDPTSSIRSYVGRWNKLARKLGVGIHPIGQDGCKDKEGHRICRKKDPSAKTKSQLYWINRNLAKSLFGNVTFKGDISTVNIVKTVRKRQPRTRFAKTESAKTCFADSMMEPLPTLPIELPPPTIHYERLPLPTPPISEYSLSDSAQSESIPPAADFSSWDLSFFDFSKKSSDSMDSIDSMETSTMDLFEDLLKTFDKELSEDEFNSESDSDRDLWDILDDIM